METDKLGVSASGTLDFRNETLDFQFNPKVRKGISIDIAGIADLVRVTRSVRFAPSRHGRRPDR